MTQYRLSNTGSAMADLTLRVQLGASVVALPPHYHEAQYPLSLSAINPADRIIQVFDYSPAFGLGGSIVRAHVQYNRPVTHNICLRLVFGTKAVRTNVQCVGSTDYELSAVVPDQHRPAERIIILVQALTLTNKVLDTVVLGPFTYGEQGMSDPMDTAHIPRPQETCCSVANEATAAHAKRVRYKDDNASMSIDPSVVHMQSPSPQSPKPSLVRRTQTRRARSNSTPTGAAKQSLMRTRPAAVTSRSYGSCVAKKAVLEVLTPLDTVAEDWREPEKQVGRRLIRFHVNRQDHVLQVTCERIEQSEYDERDIVVSCIYRAQSDLCYVTSVDIIYLLERIVGAVFKVEEKNRIRRNLEGLKPITTGKGKKWCQDFFQKIMDFPNPKPRTIEKDLKVFEWRVLGQALDKIISRYSLYSTSDVPSPTHNGATGGEDQYLHSEYEFDPMRGLVYPPPQSSMEPIGIAPSAINSCSSPRSHSLSPAFAPGVPMATDLTSDGSISTDSSPMMSNSSLHLGTPHNVASSWAAEPGLDAYNMVHSGVYISPHISPEAYPVNSGNVENATQDGFSYRAFEDTFTPTPGCASQYYM